MHQSPRGISRPPQPKEPTRPLDMITERYTVTRLSRQAKYDGLTEIIECVFILWALQHSDMNEEMKIEAMELCVTACEKHGSNNEVYNLFKHIYNGGTSLNKLPEIKKSL